MNVSVLLLTLNEEHGLVACLESLKWCKDIVLVDSGSTDRTIEIALAFNVRILKRPFDNFAAQRNFGLEYGQFLNDWVLHLDADEIATAEFAAAISNLKPSDDIDAYQIPSKMMLFGRWIRHAGMYPTYQVRLGHRDRLRFIQVGHGQREDLPPERLARLDVPYLHYSFSKGMLNWLNKHARYARDEASLILEIRGGVGQDAIADNSMSRRRAAKRQAAKLPVVLRPVLRFLYVYFWRQGFRDGRAGFAYAFMLAVYEGMTAIFVMEHQMGCNKMPPPVQLKDGG